MSTYLAMQREGQLQQIYRIFEYRKIYPKRKIAFDPQYPKTSEIMFKQHDWHDFYRDN
jgi:hypothetical protein